MTFPFILSDADQTCVHLSKSWRRKASTTRRTVERFHSLGGGDAAVAATNSSDFGRLGQVVHVSPCCRLLVHSCGGVVVSVRRQTQTVSKPGEKEVLRQAGGGGKSVEEGRCGPTRPTETLKR